MRVQGKVGFHKRKRWSIVYLDYRCLAFNARALSWNESKMGKF